LLDELTWDEEDSVEDSLAVELRSEVFGLEELRLEDSEELDVDVIVDVEDSRDGSFGVSSEEVRLFRWSRSVDDSLEESDSISITSRSGATLAR